MIVIPEFPECGFGNKALYYNNMRQLAHQMGLGFSCPVWEGCDIFDLEIHKETPTDQYALPFCLGTEYFEFKTISTRDVFKMSDIQRYERTCSIHIRETDFYAWMPESVDSAVD